jgi:hypothetical protein
VSKVEQKGGRYFCRVIFNSALEGNAMLRNRSKINNVPIDARPYTEDTSRVGSTKHSNMLFKLIKNDEENDLENFIIRNEIDINYRFKAMNR